MMLQKTYHTVDLHVDGEPLRIITDGYPEIKGKTQLERRQYAVENFDQLRRILMHEPRGHHGMYGCIITPPAQKDSDFGVLFLHNEGWSTMCGHGVIAVVTMVLETGRFTADSLEKEFRIDSPAGLVVAKAFIEADRVKSVQCEHVPSFVLYKDINLKVEGIDLKVDVSFGGAFYVMVCSADLRLKVNKRDLPALQQWGTKIKKAVEKDWEIVHPEEPELKGVYGVIFSDLPDRKDAALKNVTIFADEQVDRSPCGTGTAARLASLYAHGQIGVNEDFGHESITGGLFVGRITGMKKVGGLTAVQPLVTGSAYLTGFHQFVYDPEDSLPQGFLLEEQD